MKSISVVTRRGDLLLISVDGINSVVLDTKNGNLDIVFKYYGKLRRIADIHYTAFVGCSLYDFCRCIRKYHIYPIMDYIWYLTDNDWHRIISTIRRVYNLY